MEETTGRKPGYRRKTTLWALFGTVGLIMGAAYATGFVSTGNGATDAAGGAATQLIGKPAVSNTSLYAGRVAATTPLAITFDGNYGVIAADTNLFTVDLTGNDPYGVAYSSSNHYFADILLTNWSALGMAPGGTPEWDTLDFKIQEVDCGSTAWTPGSSTWAGYTSPAPTTAMMVVDRVDAHVTFSGLPGGTKYCFGLAPASALTESTALLGASSGSVADTVMIRPDSSAVPATAPNFTLTLNRQS